jgi:hypothetical protein
MHSLYSLGFECLVIVRGMGSYYPQDRTSTAAGYYREVPVFPAADLIMPDPGGLVSDAEQCVVAAQKKLSL